MNNGTTIATEQTELRVIKADAVALARHWDFIREKLLIVKARTNNPSAQEEGAQRIRWTPAQVRFLVLRGFEKQTTHELFFVLAADDEIRGFFITTCNLDDWLRIPMDFFIWITWSDGAFDVIDEAEPEIVKLALARGCTGIEGMTARKGYERRLRRKGYYTKFVHVRKDLVKE